MKVSVRSLQTCNCETGLPILRLAMPIAVPDHCFPSDPSLSARLSGSLKPRALALVVFLCLRLCAVAQPQISSATTANGSVGNPFFYQITVANEQFAGLDPTNSYMINTATNQPQFCAGEDAWDLIVALSNAQVETYLADRASRGFNCIWVALADNVYQSNPPHNYYGDSPFDGADFTNEDPAYWSHVDYVLGRMAAYGITAFASPAFVGDTPAHGYYSSYQNSSDATLTAYGTWLGKRYVNLPNIVWTLGGDTLPAFFSKVADIAKGIRSADSVHLITMEGTPEGDSSETQSSSGYAYCTSTCPSWLNIDWTYIAYQNVQFGCSYNYTTYPLPNLLGESFYEGEHSTTELNLREEGYWGILSGCLLGNLFGNNAIWTMGGPWDDMGVTWQSQLSSVGSIDQAWEGALFRSREFWKLRPDSSNTYLIAGYGSGTNISLLARATDGQTMIAYIPNGNQATITINMAGITSSTNTVHGWWFNPRSGATTDLGTFTNSGSRAFVPPDTNDWVLVLDDGAAALTAPGTTTMTAGSPLMSFAAAGLPAGLQVNTATGMISGTPTTAGTSTVLLNAVNGAGVGTATLTLTVSGSGSGSSPVITSAPTASGTQGVSFSYQISATNSPTSYAASGLPSGLTLDTGTGLISGTPAAAGNSTVTLSATNGAGTGTATLTLSVAAAFSLSANPAALSISPGASGSTTITLIPSGSYTGTVSLACSGLPAYATCLFSPASIRVGSTKSPLTSNLTISTNVSTAEIVRYDLRPPAPATSIPLLSGIFGTLALLFGVRRRSRVFSDSRGLVLAAVLLSAGLMSLLSACGGGIKGAGGTGLTVTPAGSYTITISTGVGLPALTLPLTVR